MPLFGATSAVGMLFAGEWLTTLRIEDYTLIGD